MKDIKILLTTILTLIVASFGTVTAQSLLIDGTLPNGTSNITGEIVDRTSGYKMLYNSMKYLGEYDEKTDYQFNSGMNSFVRIDAPEGEYFQPGDVVEIDTYVNRSASDSRIVSIYNSTDLQADNLIGTVTVPGSVAGIYKITLDDALPDKTSTIYMPATYTINSYINIHGVKIYGERGNRADLASLSLGGTAQLDGTTVKYVAQAESSESAVSLTYTKKEDKDVILAISAVQSSKDIDPSALSEWNPTIPSSLAIPAIPGVVDYYFIRSMLEGYATVYYCLEIGRQNTKDIVYNYDFTVNPVISEEDAMLRNITNTAGYHSSHGWRFNYASGSTLQVKVEGDAIIKLRGCGYNDGNSKITVSMANEEGNAMAPICSVTPSRSCSGYNTFYYTGNANTLTFSYEGVAFLSYLTIINEGSNEADFRALFVGEQEFCLSDFKEGILWLDNIGYVSNSNNAQLFPQISFGMKKGLVAPVVSNTLNTETRIFTYTFSYEGVDYTINIPYEDELGYTENSNEGRYDVTTSFGLKTVIELLNQDKAIYKKIFLPNGEYFLGNVDGNYQHGISLTASDVEIIGESWATHITGKYYGVTSSVIEIKGNNNIIRNLTLESLVGDNGVAPALSTGGSNLLFDNVQILSWQDTYVGGGGPNLFHECVIRGSVDFICNGGANTIDYFLRCNLQFQYRKNGGYVSAPQGATYFVECTVSDAPGNTTSLDGNYSLGRPWRDTGKAYFINTVFNIVPNYGFVQMSNTVFPEGSCGSVGNLKAADKTLLALNNDASTPAYSLTDEEIKRSGSVGAVCGEKLASLVGETIRISANEYTGYVGLMSVVIPEGVKGYIVDKITNSYVRIQEKYAAGDILPAETPVILSANVTTETPFFFPYSSDIGNTSESNLLKTSLIHQPTNSAFYRLVDKSNKAVFELQPLNTNLEAHEAYITTDGLFNILDLTTDGVDTGIEIPEIDNDNKPVQIYDIQARKVVNPTNGIYIKKGKKVIITR